jgi:plastocyanin
MEAGMGPVNDQSSSRGRRLLFGVVVMVILLIGLGYLLVRPGEKPKASSPSPTPATATVEITAKGFIPAELKVPRGTVVIWKGAPGIQRTSIVAANPYPADNSVPGLKSTQIGQGASWRYQFNQTGTYHYHDDLSPSTNGTIVVQ